MDQCTTRLFLMMLVLSSSARRQWAVEKNSFLKSQSPNFMDKDAIMPKQEDGWRRRVETLLISRVCSRVTGIHLKTVRRAVDQLGEYNWYTGILNRLHLVNASPDRYWLLYDRWATERQFQFLHVRFHENVSLHRQLHGETAKRCEANGRNTTPVHFKHN
jgi:hypothetical protein